MYIIPNAARQAIDNAVRASQRNFRSQHRYLNDRDDQDNDEDGDDDDDDDDARPRPSSSSSWQGLTLFSSPLSVMLFSQAVFYRWICSSGHLSLQLTDWTLHVGPHVELFTYPLF